MIFYSTSFSLHSFMNFKNFAFYKQNQKISYYFKGAFLCDKLWHTRHYSLGQSNGGDLENLLLISSGVKVLQHNFSVCLF